MLADVAAPSTEGPWPGVVLVDDFTGMSHDLRDQADWLAREGFLAAASDRFHWGGRVSCLRTVMRDRGARRDRSFFQDIAAVRGWLVGRSGCTAGSGVIGIHGRRQRPGACGPRGSRVEHQLRRLSQGRRESWLSGACPIVDGYGVVTAAVSTCDLRPLPQRRQVAQAVCEAT